MTRLDPQYTSIDELIHCVHTARWYCTRITDLTDLADLDAAAAGLADAIGAAYARLHDAASTTGGRPVLPIADTG